MKKTLTAIWSYFKKFGEFVASIVNFILLLPVYFVGVGLSAVLLKIKKEKQLPLELHEEKGSESYWKVYDLGTKAKETYKRMF